MTTIVEYLLAIKDSQNALERAVYKQAMRDLPDWDEFYKWFTNHWFHYEPGTRRKQHREKYNMMIIAFPWYVHARDNGTLYGPGHAPPKADE